MTHEGMHPSRVVQTGDRQSLPKLQFSFNSSQFMSELRWSNSMLSASLNFAVNSPWRKITLSRSSMPLITWGLWTPRYFGLQFNIIGFFVFYAFYFLLLRCSSTNDSVGFTRLTQVSWHTFLRYNVQNSTKYYQACQKNMTKSKNLLQSYILITLRTQN